MSSQLWCIYEIWCGIYTVFLYIDRDVSGVDGVTKWHIHGV